MFRLSDFFPFLGEWYRYRFYWGKIASFSPHFGNVGDICRWWQKKKKKKKAKFLVKMFLILGISSFQVGENIVLPVGTTPVTVVGFIGNNTATDRLATLCVTRLIMKYAYFERVHIMTVDNARLSLQGQKVKKKKKTLQNEEATPLPTCMTLKLLLCNHKAQETKHYFYRNNKGLNCAVSISLSKITRSR